MRSSGMSTGGGMPSSSASSMSTTTRIRGQRPPQPPMRRRRGHWAMPASSGLLMMTVTMACLCLLLLPTRVAAFWGLPSAAPRPLARSSVTAALWSTPDPGGEFVKRRTASSAAAAPNATAAAAAAAGAAGGRPAGRGRGGAGGGGAPAMPPMKETMQLLFSPDKRQIDKNRAQFREVVAEMQAAPLEEVMGIISRSMPFFLSTNTTIFMQEMLEELDAQAEDAVVALGGGYQVTVGQQRAALVNLFTLTMDFIEGFVQHTQGELRSHQAVLKEILEAAQNKSAAALDETIRRLRPQFREDFLTYLRGEYEKVTRPPMTEDGVVLANLLQAIQGRVLAEMESMMGADVGQVSRLLAFTDEAQVATALRGSFLAGTVQPQPFLEMVETVLGDLDERMPGLLEEGKQAAELREMHRKLSSIRDFTKDYLSGLS